MGNTKHTTGINRLLSSIMYLNGVEDMIPLPRPFLTENFFAFIDLNVVVNNSRLYSRGPNFINFNRKYSITQEGDNSVKQ